MRKRRQNNLVGKNINGYELIEEIKQDIEFKSPQDKHRKRLFKVRRDGEESFKTLGELKYKHKKLSERVNFTDRTGTICGDWEIVEIAEDYVIKHGDSIPKTGALWKARNRKTGEVVIDRFPYINCKNYGKNRWKQSHGYLKRETRGSQKDAYLYYTWKNMRDRCTITENSQYHNWGGKGFKYDDDRWNCFETFRLDIQNSIGNRPSSKYTLIPIDGKYFCKNNVAWGRRRSKRHSITHPGNAIIE